ncbi:MAG: hypothetical protein A4S12_08770 [Proteobacteria bacterium SG_bin5]|nr:SPOR domain-containing protein [Sphingomonas sp.]OQW41458.1 MAG: hypothetical protein A4S12_08770 [Proteobacteria bacterium SG_bin5]
MREALRDEDRLPWLETVDEDYEDRPSTLRVALFALLGLALLAALVFGAYALRRQVTEPSKGNGELIAAPEGDYKIKPEKEGGMKVEGEGDLAYAASAGKRPDKARIDPKQLPESPMVMPGKGAMPRDAGGGAVVQIGSFPDKAGADAAWARQAKRFAFLGGLGHAVEKAEVAGRTVYRLRVNAGGANAARELCNKLRVAGEACFIVRG